MREAMIRGGLEMILNERLIQNAKSSRNSGFTLVELSIVLVVTGLMVLYFLRPYEAYLVAQKERETRENIHALNSIMKTVYGSTRRYPCPANPDLAPGDPGYGFSQCRNNNPAAGPVTYGTNPCADGSPLGITLVDSGLDRNNDGVNDCVMIGAFPFNEVRDIFATNGLEGNVDPAYFFDGYDNYYMYAVSELLTDQTAHFNNPTNAQHGVINVLDEIGVSVIQPAESAHYVIYSLGRNELGAWSQTGDLQESCNASSLPADPFSGGGADTPGFDSGQRLDTENCDNVDNTFLRARTAHADGLGYYDDYLVYSASNASALWDFRSDGSGGLIAFNRNSGNVGINDETPDSARLTVGGSVFAETKVSAPLICDASGSICIDPEFISDHLSGADEARQRCPAGEAAIGIRGVVNPSTGISMPSLICQPVNFPTANRTCPTFTDVLGNTVPRFLRSIATNGHYMCTDAAGGNAITCTAPGCP